MSVVSRVTTPDQLAAHKAAVNAIHVAMTVAPLEEIATTVLATHKLKSVLISLKSVVSWKDTERITSSKVHFHNDVLAKVQHWPKMLEDSGLVLSELETVLLHNIPVLLFLASDGKRYLAPKAPKVPRGAMRRLIVGTGIEPVIKTDAAGVELFDAVGRPIMAETRILAASRRYRLAEGETEIRQIITDAVTTTNVDRLATLHDYVANPKKIDKVGFWAFWRLELGFVDALTGKIIRMFSDDKRIDKALTITSPGRKTKRTVDVLGMEMNALFQRKIKEMLRAKDLREHHPVDAKIVVFCHEPTCVHSEGFYDSRKHFHVPFLSQCTNLHQTCNRCMSAWHVGPCEDEAAAMDPETRAVMLATSKTCPGCHTLVEKTAGCNHMTCRCGQHFCWRCCRAFTAGVGWVPHDSEDGVTCRMTDGVYGLPVVFVDDAVRDEDDEDV
jgi:hypothetical protein